MTQLEVRISGMLAVGTTRRDHGGCLRIVLKRAISMAGVTMETELTGRVLTEATIGNPEHGGELMYDLY